MQGISERAFVFSGVWMYGRAEEPTEFERSGLDADELEYMGANERKRVLEHAGLNPDDYDF